MKYHDVGEDSEGHYKGNFALSKFDRDRITKTQFYLYIINNKIYDILNWDGWWVVLLTLTILALFCGLLYLIYQSNYISCERFANLNNLEFQFYLVGGCYIKTDSGWFSLDQIVNILFNK